MKITLDQVRTALINIANEKGRPHYGMGVIRDVYNAILKKEHHCLRHITMQEIFTLNSHVCKPHLELAAPPKDAPNKLQQIKQYYAGQKVLVSKSGVSDRTISLILRGKLEMSPKIWNKIAPIIDDVLEHLKKHHEEKEKKSHGKYVTYRKGCRCGLCREAWRSYIKDRNLRVKNQVETLELLENDQEIWVD